MRLWLGKPREASLEPEDNGVEHVIYPQGKSGPIVPARGEANGRCGLRASEVDDIRRLEAKESLRSIARLYQVDHKTISQIRDGVTWKERVGWQARD